MNNFEVITLSNGLKIFMMQDNSKHTTYFNLIVKFGGLDREINYNKKNIKIPNGTAHFLEHLVLECSCYGDLMEYFGTSGIRSNGLTNINSTRFYIDAVENIYDAIEKLLIGVHSPIINKNNIEKIKGPIIEEKRRSLDNKYVELYNNTLSAIADNKKFDSILGSFKDIELMNSSNIKLCHEALYRPSNEYIVVGGKFDRDKLIKLIEDIYKNLEFTTYRLSKVDIKHKDKVNKKKISIEANTGIDRAIVTFKLNTKDLTPFEKLEMDGHLFAFLKMNFGIVSDFHKELLKDNIITDEIIYSNSMLEGYHVIRIEANTFKTEEFINRVLDIFQNKDFVFDKEIYELTKRGYIFNFITRKDSIYATIDPLIENITSFGYESVDKLEDIEKSSFNEFKKYINMLNFTNYNIAILTQI